MSMNCIEYEIVHGMKWYKMLNTSDTLQRKPNVLAYVLARPRDFLSQAILPGKIKA